MENNRRREKKNREGKRGNNLGMEMLFFAKEKKNEERKEGNYHGEGNTL